MHVQDGVIYMNIYPYNSDHDKKSLWYNLLDWNAAHKLSRQKERWSYYLKYNLLLCLDIVIENFNK